MSHYARLSADDAYQMMIDREVSIVDLRDEQSFSAGRIVGALHLDNSSVQSFINEADHSQPVIVCCYHGNMSQSAGAFLASAALPKCTAWMVDTSVGPRVIPTIANLTDSRMVCTNRLLA